MFTQAKGKVITQFLGIFYFAFYIVISYFQSYYGEVILYSIIMIPLYIYGIIHWLRNRDKKENVVIVRSNLSKKEWIWSSACFVLVCVGVFFLLKALGTAQLWLSTIVFVSILPAVYLLVRRVKWNQVAFLFNDIALPILWLVLVFEGRLEFIPMCVGHLFQVVYDIYGLIEWNRLEKKQKAEKDKSNSDIA